MSEGLVAYETNSSWGFTVYGSVVSISDRCVSLQHLFTLRSHGQIPSGGQYQIDAPVSPELDDALEIAYIESSPVPPYTELNESIPIQPETGDTGKDINLSSIAYAAKSERGGSHMTLITKPTDHGVSVTTQSPVAVSKLLPARGSSNAIMGLDERFVRLEKILTEQKEAEEKMLAIKQRAEIIAAEEKAVADKKKSEKEALKLKPIRFKDAVGRKFSFPFHLCQTWKVWTMIYSNLSGLTKLSQGMEDLIRQAFLHVDVIGPHVAEGHYDLVGPNGEIILPHVWETMVEPEWTITMHMWPMPEPHRVDARLQVDSGLGKSTIMVEDRKRPLPDKDDEFVEAVEEMDHHSIAPQSESGKIAKSKQSVQPNSGRSWAGMMEFAPRMFGFFSQPT